MPYSVPRYHVDLSAPEAPPAGRGSIAGGAVSLVSIVLFIAMVAVWAAILN